MKEKLVPVYPGMIPLDHTRLNRSEKEYMR